MVQLIEKCGCGSTHTRWEDENGFSSNHNYLRCMRCGETLRTRHNALPWLFFLIALAAAAWGWISIGWPDAFRG